MNVVLALRRAHTRLALELVLNEEPGITVVGMASETEGLLALVRTARPDLLVVEWGLPGRPAATVLAEAFGLAGRLKVLVVANDLQSKQPALLAGTHAFVVIGDPPELLLAAVRQVRLALRQ